MVTLDEAYAACERLARQHYENFPVASLMLPARMRPHIAAIYAFARTADDFADEGDRPAAERLRLLDDWIGRLHGTTGTGDRGPETGGKASRWSRDRAAPPHETQVSPAPDTSAGSLQDPAVRASQHSGPTSGLDDVGTARVCPSPSVSAGQHPGPRSPVPDPILIALAETIRVRALPVSLFEDLISAFRQDVTVTRYDTWDDVLDYCRRSANPVGRLVLRVAGIVRDEADIASDAVCTALQLTNFWQDLERDWVKGRLYVPRADRERWGADERDLAGRRLTPEWRRLMAEMGARTAALFDRGRPVCDMVRGRLRWELRFTWLGGRRILDRLDRIGYDVFAARPALGLADVPALAWQALTWR